ncbi:paramecium surface antigen repeat-containing protein [Dictyostelium discoideum AX4]|uniref:Paramecium surface antigen repeat-containing protein n=1 Tax=Dictyostelium discoideum TaxID=44689 RepID=Q54KB3_DICDI|nr:paramecium surface antigen repeat-containing protein [Dictyostelium discoideum AX4]EAL63711.1 paramecium surface antigen repeat-containing protein [Dictyostelium discoideum AX4]|eukprot:XP_637208.1 paramecium surface antigen repeat-containing protein [Dictyostelium discoideum AX4]
MKINSILFIILLILFYNVVNSSCPNCLKENDICDSGGTCSDDTKCLSNNSSSPRCTKYLKSGDKCDPGVYLCILGTSCILDKSNVYRCLDYGFRSLGEQCQLQSDCVDQLDCINNVCSHDPTKYTHCHDIDESCNYDEYCYCTASSNCVCQKINTQGSPCNYSRDCLGGLTCNSGVCGNPQLIELGGSCLGTYNCDNNNDYCYYNGFCDYNKGLYCSDNICQEFVQPSPKSCSPNATVSECSAYQTCSCSDHECYQSGIYPPESLKMIASSQLEKCAYDNKCSLNVNLYSSESCLSKHCRKEICQRYVGDYKVKEEDDCGKEELRADLLFCSSNSSSKISQSLTYLLIVLFIVFQIIF